MATVEDMILHYELVQEPGLAGYEKVLRAGQEIRQALEMRAREEIRQALEMRAREEIRQALEMEEPARREDEIHPAWIVLGALLVAAEYFWLLVVAT